VLSGQRYPSGRAEGIQWVAECICTLVPVAREYDVIMGIENHYKDGFWRYPEFAQKRDVFLTCWRPSPSANISACSSTPRTPS